MNIYCGNLSFDMNDDDLNQAFEAYGEVTSAKVIMDRMTGKSRGFGFVEMPDDSNGQTAIDELNGKDLKGREIRLNIAKPREDNRGGGGGGRY